MTRRWLLAAALWPLAAAAVLVPAALRAQGSGVGALPLTMPSVVMVLGVDLEAGELVPMSSGSGTIVSADGAVLTNHHVLHDARGDRLYPLFLIGRFRGADRDPELVCAGSPATGELRPELDLAIVRCDRDLDGQPYRAEGWPPIPLGDSLGIVPGEQVWVLGYPNAGRGGIRVSAGLVSGWTGEEGGTSSRAFMRTDASVSAGNSGGAAVDRTGRLIGVPTAFRTVSREGGKAVTVIGRIGLIRPIEAARDLLAALAAPAAAPGAVLPGEAGAMIGGTVVEAGSLRPVAGALVLALPEGTRAAALDRPGALGELVLAWGISDADGTYVLEPPLPRGRAYTLAVTAAGYLPGVQPDAARVPERGAHALLPAPPLRLVRRGLR